MKYGKFSTATLALIALINLYFLVAVRICDYNGSNWKTIIYSDGKGYYEYLRAAFINRNLGKEDSSLGFIRISDHGPVMKFFCGPAVAYAPFFAVAYATSFFNSEVSDGYSKDFQISIALAGYCYLLLGLYFLRKLLQQFHFSDITISLTLLLITYGTNLFYYGILEPSMSHVYAFACVTGFVFSAHQYFTSLRLKHLILASIFFGLTILIRPTNVIVLFMVPFLVGKKGSFFLYLRNASHLFLSLVIVSGFVFIQMIFWKLQTGHWIVWSYTGEGFYFTRPAIFNVLFSYDKGWFVYTPLTAIAMIGFYPLWKMNRRAAISIAFTLVAAIYFTAAWWCWDYANSFGMRPLIDFYSLIAVLLVTFISSLKKSFLKIIFAVLLLFLFVLSGIQTYQYYEGIFQHYSMNKGKYWYVFMKTNDDYKNILGGNVDLMPYTRKAPQLIHQFSEADINASSNAKYVSDPQDSSNNCFRFDSVSTMLSYSLPADSSIDNAQMLYVKISLRRMELERHSSEESRVNTMLLGGMVPVFTYQFSLNDFPDDKVMQWRNYHYAFWIRKPTKPFSTVEIEIENPGRKDFLVDDLEIKIFRMFP